MRKDRSNDLVEFSHDAMEKLDERKHNLDKIIERTKSRLVTSLYAELTVHLVACGDVIADLHRELAEWLSTRGEGKTPQPSNVEETIADMRMRIDEAGWSLALNALKTCAQTVGVNNTEKLLD